MKIRLLSVALVLALVFILGAASSVSAGPPGMPHAFYGNVTIGVNSAPVGTTVSAHIGSLSWSTTTSGGKYGYSPTFMIPADNPETPAKDGGVNGDGIIFKVNGTPATTYTFQTGGVTKLDLAIEGEVPVTYYTLTVTVSPSGGGTVSRNPADQDPTTPGYQYEDGTTVTLTATPANDYEFDYWSGNASGTSPTASVTMTSDKSVTANFSTEVAPPPPPPHSGSVGGTAYLPNKAAIVAPWIALGAALVAVLGWLVVRRRRASG